MKIFLKRLAGFSLGPVIGAVVSLITVPLTTYFISPNEFGKSSMFTIMLGFINIVLYLGMDQSFAREYHEEEDKLSLFFNASFLPILFSVLLLIVMSCYRNSVSIYLFGSSNYSFVSILFGIMLVFSVLERFILMNLRMQEKAVEYSIFSIFVKVTVLIALIILLLCWKRNFLTVVYSTIFGQILGDIYLIFRYKYFFSKFSVKNINISLIKRMVLFGFPLLVSVSLNSFLNALGTLAIRNWSDFHELGIFSAGQRIANFLNIVQMAFTSFWVPTAYRWNKEKKSIDNFKLISDILLLVLSIGFFGIVIFKQFVVFILSSEYLEAKYIISFLVLVPVLYTLSETTTLGIVFSKKSYLNIFISIGAVIPCLLLNFFLVPKFGNRGASFAISIAYAIFFLLRSYFSLKNGFGFSLRMQFIVIILMFGTSILNMFDFKGNIWITVILFFVTIMIQYSTIKIIFKIAKGEIYFDLN